MAKHFLKKIAEKYHKNITGLKAETLSFLEHYTWPGNVRELENAIERMIILAEENVEYITFDLLPQEIISNSFVITHLNSNNLPYSNIKDMKKILNKVEDRTPLRGDEF